MINLDTFKDKQVKLDTAKSNLKKQFFGLDEIIDRIFDIMSGWYFFPELQEKPLIVNLWGLTGTGKTSLVKAIINELELKRRSFIYDGRKQNRHSENLGSLLQFIHDQFNHEPFILMIDEFQNGRTIDAEGGDRENNTDMDLWELLDTGRIQAELKSREVYSLAEMRFEVNRRIRSNLSLTGYEEENISRTANKKHLRPRNPNDSNDILNYYKDDLYKANSDRFDTEMDAYDFVAALSPKEVLSFISESLEKLLEPKDIDATKGLIFIAGNIDEAYRDIADFDQEMDADVLAERSEEISIQTIKKALQFRFRKEQI